MNNLVEIKAVGMVCDNPSCGWADMTVSIEGAAEWVNQPCPKCGEVILTEKDIADLNRAKNWAAFLNSLSPEQLELLTGEKAVKKFLE